MPDKIKINVLLFLLTFAFMLFSVTGCTFFQSQYKDLSDNVKGKLLIRGYKVSGSMNIFWVIDLPSNKVEKLYDEDLINLLNLKYISFSKYNVDDQKVRYHNDLIYKRPEIIFSSNFNEDLFNFIIEPQINPLINVKNDSIISFNYKYKVIPDYKNRKLMVIDLKDKKEFVKTFDNIIFGFTFSPDNQYLAFFEHHPFAFSDGSVYELSFLELKTGEVFKIKDGQVSLPGSIIWLEKMP